MGKIEENKQQKLSALYDSAYDLFMTRGITKTSIQDIVQKAGVAKGTFYLYFKDKYDIRDKLSIKIVKEVFQEAFKELEKTDISDFEDKLIFVVDYVLEMIVKNKSLVQLISKKLSWGMLNESMIKDGENREIGIWDYFYERLKENPQIKFENPEIMLFLIIELAGATAYSTIVEDYPISYEEVKPYLNKSIRSIMKNHMIEE